MEGNFGGKDAEILEIGEQTGEWKYYYNDGKIKAMGLLKKVRKKEYLKIIMRQMGHYGWRNTMKQEKKMN